MTRGLAGSGGDGCGSDWCSGGGFCSSSCSWLYTNAVYTCICICMIASMNVQYKKTHLDRQGEKKWYCDRCGIGI
jgi:hypothetical protein